MNQIFLDAFKNLNGDVHNKKKSVQKYSEIYSELIHRLEFRIF